MLESFVSGFNNAFSTFNFEIPLSNTFSIYFMDIMIWLLLISFVIKFIIFNK